MKTFARGSEDPEGVADFGIQESQPLGAAGDGTPLRTAAGDAPYGRPRSTGTDDNDMKPTALQGAGKMGQGGSRRRAGQSLQQL